jgi:hypothetical protein
LIVLHRKFAVIKLWPGLKTAEDECIARLKITARSLGLECLEVDSFARLVETPHVQLTRDDVDFVLSLHFETPKRYDIFSFVALWNPLQFFHEWGYRKFTRNLLTHDDFLSCSSSWADDHVKRSIAGDSKRAPPELQLYHSLSEPVFRPTTGDGKLFYAGINWERVGNRPQRHGALLKLLDKTGDLRIYGPKVFSGVQVWAGYKSYQGSIPFDGVSMVRLINKAGISLVLSSEAHRQSELMSSRLFESLAAGAVIICDENPFVRRHFGETVLYVDTTINAQDTYAQVQSHLSWIRSEPTAAQELAQRAQEIFLRDFSLDHCLRKIYRELPARKQKLECLYVPKGFPEKITLIFLLPEFQPEVVERHIASCLAQKHVMLRPIVAMDGRDFERFGHRLQVRLNQLSTPITISTLDFFERSTDGTVKSRRRTGSVIHEAIERLVEDDYFCLVAPNERLFSDHLCSLMRSLQDSEEAGSAWADMLLSHVNDSQERADLNDEPGDAFGLPDKPIGLGRFLFRKSALAPDLGTVLPYLDATPMDLLWGMTKSLPTRRCTLLSDVQDRFNQQISTVARPQEEREVITDYAPSFFVRRKSAAGHEAPVELSLDTLTAEQKTKLAVDLAHSVPLPEVLRKIGFGLYRLWLRRKNARG